MIHYKYWLALQRARGIGPAAIQEIFDTITALSLSIADIFSCTQEEIRSEFAFSEHILNGIAEAQTLLESIEEEYLTLVEAGITTTLLFEDTYPQALHKLGSHAPSVLYSIGNIKLASTPSAALISHGETSPKGERIAVSSAHQLVQRSITVAGGLSKGAITSAHITALENRGSTIAVIPCGFLTFDMHKRLTELFDPDRFLILSPFSPNEPYSKFNAMSRNRLLCALSKAVFIIESTKDGGTIDAAKSAHKLGTPLYTAEYSEYPSSAEGNPLIIKDYSATPVRGRKDGANIVPNIDALIASVKFM